MRANLTATVLFWAGFSVGFAADPPAPRSTESRLDDDRVTSQFSAGQVVYSIRCPKGIGHTSIPKPARGWPETVVLHLHLRGLESLTVQNTQTTIAGAVSSQDGKIRLWKDGQEDRPLTAHSPFWLSIRSIGPDGKAVSGLPPEQGYFELTLPRPFFKQNPDSFTVRWIDFYRN